MYVQIFFKRVVIFTVALLSMVQFNNDGTSALAQTSDQQQPLTLTTGNYLIRSRASGRLLDVVNGDSANGANVQLWESVGNSNQQWRFERQSDDTYKITALHSGRSLDVRDWSNADGAALQQWGWSGGDNQRWFLTNVGDGFVRITAKSSGKVLDVKDFATGNGALVQLWSYWGGANQQWRIERADSLPFDAPRDERNGVIAVPACDCIVPASAYFVAPTGSDQSGDGSINKPWASFERALSAAPANGVIVFRGGTYRIQEKFLLWKALTLQAYPGEQVWIKGSQIASNWQKHSSRNVWRTSWSKFFPNITGAESFRDPNNTLPGERDMVFVNGRALKQVARWEDIAPGTFYANSSWQEIHIGDDPTGKLVEITAAEAGLGMFPRNDGASASGTVVKGLGFTHFANNPIEMSVPRIRLENNAFVWNALSGVTVYGPWGNINADPRTMSTDDVITGNLFADNGLYALTTVMSHRLRFENNTVSRNNIEGFKEPQAFKANVSDQITVKNNVFEDNDGNAIWLDVGVRNAIVVGNIVRRNAGNGIFFEISNGAIIASNIFEANGINVAAGSVAINGIVVSNSANARIYNNTFVNNVKPLDFEEVKRGPLTNEPDYHPGWTNWVARDNVAKNNLIINALGTNAPDAINVMIDNWWYWERPTDLPPLVSALDYNVYVRTAAGEPGYLARWVRNGGSGWQRYANLAEFRATFSQYEQHGREINNIALSDLFVNPAVKDYRLKNGSALRGAGEALPANIAAIEVQSGIPVDVGSFNK